ncbi:hypothetical protein ACVWZW_005298 [Bradyrhizobium sp. F1.13.4]
MRRQHHRDTPSPGVLIGLVVDRDADGDAGIVDDDVEPAEMRSDVADHALDLAAVGNIELPGFRSSAACRDLLRHGQRTLLVIVGDGNVGALSGEHACRRASHAAGGAGDENSQALHGPAELFEIGHAVSLCHACSCCD